jgi:outer membrane scaffolding protein for murein synthesis (MipA/OmpV family)
VFPAIGGTAIYRLTPAWNLFTAARFDFLGQEWLDSPLIKNEYRFQILTALQYTF